MNASDHSAMTALRSWSVATTRSSVTPWWASSRSTRPLGITPVTRPPAASAASATTPIRPSRPPPYTSPIPRRASSSPTRAAAAAYAGSRPGLAPQNTQMLRSAVISEAQLTQDRRHPTGGLAPVRDRVLRLLGPLAERPAARRLRFGLEDGVIAEAARSAGRGRDPAPAGPADRPLGPVGQSERQDADVLRAPLRRGQPVERAEQLRVVLR